ncbi:hypothetical protein JNUCC0626_40245 [Lentzea sp. JNUCC 0626]
MHESTGSHQMFVVISSFDGMPADLHQFEDEESATRFYREITA